jgi:gliding motility-associated lipoprotein GldB
MKKISIILLLIITCISCSKKDKIQEKTEKISVNINVDRYDKAFFEIQPEKLNILKQKYPDFFPPTVSDSVLIEKMQNPLWRELYSEVQKKFKNFDDEKEAIQTLFQYIKYYYPKTEIPKVTTVIQEMDTDYKVIYTPKMLIISLELYLGKNHKFYEFPKYMKQTFEQEQMLPDIVEAFSKTKVKPPTDKEFLSQIIYTGKQLYLKDILLPDASNEVKMCYTTAQLKYCTDNEANMWRFFVQENLLYDSNPKLVQRFIAPGPFSKFGMITDNETPAKVGAWFGLQIVRAFMENNNIPPQQMFVLDAKEIFQKSKYKPRK